MHTQGNDTQKKVVPMPIILVVEDEAMLRIVAAEVLTDAGFRVVEAAHGGEAWKMLQAGEAFDLVLSDVKMPVMDGYQLAVASIALKPTLKILLMTGYTQDPLPPILQQAGVQVLQKPFDFGALPQLVRNVLDA